jgi:hypothetical protein
MRRIIFAQMSILAKGYINPDSSPQRQRYERNAQWMVALAFTNNDA